MTKAPGNRRNVSRINRLADPPGKTKLIAALRHLLEERDFNSITTAEIAKSAETNEALIYRYFGDKRGLLHRVLAEYLQQMLDKIDAHSELIDDPIERLRTIIWDTFEIYGKYRVFAKIVLFEARCFTGYFESDAYQLVRRYAHLIYDTIEECIEAGEFRNDIPPRQVRDSIIGMIEHLTMHDCQGRSKSRPQRRSKSRPGEYVEDRGLSGRRASGAEACAA